MVHYVLHIGLTKTGSTTIQGFLTENAPRLLEADIVYPCGREFPQRRQQSWIVDELISGHHQKFSTLLQMCRGHRQAVISGENLVRLPIQKVRELKARLESEGGADSFKIIMYVRNIGDRMLSLCFQKAKSRGLPYHVTIARFGRDIRERLEKYETVFGYEAVEVRLLENAALLQRDFCEAAGLPWHDDYALPKPDNVSPDPLATQVVQLLQIEFGRDPRDFNALPKRKLPRLENHYLRQIEAVLPEFDLDHPKLMPFAAQMKTINWRDESTGPTLAEYLDSLIAALERIRDEAASGRRRPRYVDPKSGALPPARKRADAARLTADAETDA